MSPMAAAGASIFKNLDPLAQSGGKSFLRYPVPTSGKLHDAELDQKKLIKAKDVLAALVAANPNRLKKTDTDTDTEML